MACKRCGNCCRYNIHDPGSFKNDMEWLEARDGKIVGKYALVPTIPCKHLNGNDCTIHNEKPVFCVYFPGEFLEVNHDWLYTMGCRFFEEE